ncbi:helix-turn-helix transcriptional regulator [Pseudonocardia sp. NPDC049154]|uniref:helix-turn-helix domain-containing protein n=1 Tax=Pseudonocardia sp. NPDC049154 TaxID=3155501 RepID=UPI003401FB0A
MAPQQGPAGPRRRLGAELRRLRLNADMTLDEVAEKMTCSTSKISRLETGKGIPKLPDVNELIRIYGVTSDAEQDMLRRLVREGRTQGWWEPYVEGVHPERFVLDSPGRYPALETEAVAVRPFTTTFLHGLLQTREYATLLMAEMLPHHSEAEVEQLVEIRMQRQRALMRDDEPLRLAAVLDEALLNRQVGDRAVMDRQLRVLVELSERDNVDIRVLPFDAGLHRALAGPFTVLELRDRLADVVYIEGAAGDSYLDTPADVKLYKEIHADVSARAVDPAASRDLLLRYLRRHT